MYQIQLRFKCKKHFNKCKIMQKYLSHCNRKFSNYNSKTNH